MQLTEDQARTKWCPHSRVVHTECDYKAVVPANAFGDGTRSLATRCIASACMAWRWDISIQELPTGDFWLRTDDKTLDGVEVPRLEARGFCGLAGKVEG